MKKKKKKGRREVWEIHSVVFLSCDPSNALYSPLSSISSVVHSYNFLWIKQTLFFEAGGFLKDNDSWKIKKKNLPRNPVFAILPALLTHSSDSGKRSVAQAHIPENILH